MLRLSTTKQKLTKEVLLGAEDLLEDPKRDESQLFVAGCVV